jgi:hypothetical protein
MGWKIALLVLGGMHLLIACSPVPQDPASEARALLEKRLGAKVAIQSIVTKGDRGTICGYATRKAAGYYPELIPFVMTGNALVLRSDDLENFNRAQRACGPSWVGPRDVEGIS